MVACYGTALAFWGLLVTHTHSPDHRLPFLDEGDLGWLLERHLGGVIRWRDLWIPHGDAHWNAGAYAVLMPLALPSRWDTFWEVTGNLFTLLLVWDLGGVTVRDTARRPGEAPPAPP